MVRESFWSDKRVVITGHTGFVGTWLAMVLDCLGAELYGISLPSEPGSIYDRVKNHLAIDAPIIDIRDKESLKDVIFKLEPEIVFHLAAFGFIQECIYEPERAFDTNAIGTYNVLETVSGCDAVKSIIVASSDKVYKNEGTQCLFNENDALGGIDPYSASKTCEDMIANSYYDTYLKGKNIGMRIVRPSNILGGGDHHENRLIPSIYNAFDQGEEPIIRNPNAVRPWQDILDMCDAYIFLAEQAFMQSDFDIVNVGPKPDGVCTVGEIAGKVGALYGKQITFGADRNNIVSEHMWLGLSIEKVEGLGWSPKMTIDDTLKNVYQCYKCKSDDDLYKTCTDQILEYYKDRELWLNGIMNRKQEMK